jgi:outer membrane murein-binding lipoprotein Lpp
MKSRFLIGLIVLACVVFAGLAASQDREDDPARQVESLKKQVAALEDRVAKLEAAIQKITVSIPQGFPELKQLPKGWRRREFNGIPYYIIPIDSGAKVQSLEKR